MTTYYVGKGGNDGNAGTSWALRKLTLDGAEDIPVVAGDTVIVGPGYYRETLTVDVSGGLGNPITYVGDIFGENTDGVGGTVRVTGSDDDLTAARNILVDASGAQRNYRTFRGFHFDTNAVAAGSAIIYATSNPQGWIIEDCTFSVGDGRAITMTIALDLTIRRCIIHGASYDGIYLHGVADNRNVVIENCIVGLCARGIDIEGTGDVTVRNCYFHNCGRATGQDAIESSGLNAGQQTKVYNTILVNNLTALNSDLAARFDEDYNLFLGNTTDRTGVNVGANSVTYCNLIETPLLYAGQGQASGFVAPWFMYDLSEWHQCVQWGGTSPPAHDLFGVTRPTTAGKRSISACQYQQYERDTSLVYGGGISSLLFNDAGRFQLQIAHEGVPMTVELYVQRGATYAGVNPQMVIKQPSQADRTTTDTGGSGTWNLLSDSFTPAALPPWLVVEMVSDNTAAGAGINANFDEVQITV